MRYFLIVVLFLTLHVNAAEQKVLIDLTSGDMNIIKSRLGKGLAGMARYMKSQSDSLNATVVIHGDAYKFFVKNLEHSPYWEDEKLGAAQEELEAMFKELVKEYNVVFEVCRVGLQNRKILSEDLYEFVTPIPSAMIGLTLWQNRGYAFVPVQ